MGSHSSHSSSRQRRRCTPWRLVVLSLLCVSSSGVIKCSAVGDRTGAFIGYSEAAIPGYGRCTNKLDDCEQQAAMNRCLTDPYRMRRLCPVSCLVEPCVSQGSVLNDHTFKGHATESGTGLYAKALAATVGANHFNRVAWGTVEDPGKPGSSKPSFLYLSSLGTGTYLGAADELADEQVLSAIMYSATRGWNVIDTAPNYRNGRAEAAIGRALSLLLMGNTGQEFPESRLEVTRDALFISSKAGYLTPVLKRELLSRKLVNASDILGGMHCLAPACIRASLASSLTKLRIQTLDLLYLHNAAEVQLEARGKEGFKEVLKIAFKELEALRAEGKIRAYGLATWESFRTPFDVSPHLDLEEIVQLAKEVGGEHHGFMAIQAPINLRMDEAFLKKWQRVVNQTATDAANKAAAAAAEAAVKAAKAAAAAAEAAAAAAAEEAEQAGRPAPVAQPPPPATAPPPPAPHIVVHNKVSLGDAAIDLGIQLFASAPFMEAQLLQGMVGTLAHVMDYEDIRSTSGKLLQYVRSMPAVTSALVGHKAEEHVVANVALAAVPQLTPRLWLMAQDQMQQALKQQQQRL